jgi:DNA mismatch repair protein MSH5
MHLCRHACPSQLISTHDLTRLLDEQMTEKERVDLEDAEAVCRRFLAWDLDANQADVKKRLQNCLGRDKEESITEN